MSQVVSGQEFSPPRVMIYGIDGIGKSTFASQAPKAIFIQTEDGLKQIGASRFPVSKSYEDVIEKLTALATEKHDYQTVAIDSMSGLERLIFSRVCQDAGKDNIDTVGGGFDKGQKLSMTYWFEVIKLLDRCRDNGMAILLIAHARPEDLGDPENPMVKQFAPAIHVKTSGNLFRQWADATLFLTRRMAIKKEGQGIMEKKIGVAVGPDGGERIIKTSWSPTAVAKNRYDMPSEIPFPKVGAWDVFMSYVVAFHQKGQA